MLQGWAMKAPSTCDVLSSSTPEFWEGEGGLDDGAALLYMPVMQTLFKGKNID